MKIYCLSNDAHTVLNTLSNEVMVYQSVDRISMDDGQYSEKYHNTDKSPCIFKQYYNHNIRNFIGPYKTIVATFTYYNTLIFIHDPKQLGMIYYETANSILHFFQIE